MPTRTSLRLALAMSVFVTGVMPSMYAAPAAPAATTLPAFDVISVKTNNSAAQQKTLQFTPDGIRVTNLAIDFILRGAFSVNEDQLINLPDWARSIAYDIEAKVAPEDVTALKNLNRDQHFALALQMVTDRFKLTYHHETRILPEYALVIAKTGSKLNVCEPSTEENQKPRGSILVSGTSITGEAIDMAMFTRLLAENLGHPVIDKTGLAGKYSFQLEWAPEAHESGPAHNPGPDSASAPGDSGGPSIFTAVQEQLGLKLESQKGPVDVIVIDHIEQPAAN